MTVHSRTLSFEHKRNSSVMCMVFLAFFAWHSPLSADPFEKAPPAFDQDNRHFVPINILSMHTSYIFDIAQAKALGESNFIFETKEDGLPLFDVVSRVTTLILDEQELAPSDLLTIDDPGNQTTLRSINATVSAGQQHTVRIRFELTNGVEFATNKLKVGFFTSDLTVGGRTYFESFGVSNLEFDQFPHEISTKIVGGDGRYELMTNGAKTLLADQHWKIVYPSYFNCASLYFHIIDKNRFTIRQTNYQGLSALIPVTSYAENPADADRGLAGVQRFLKELEASFGPYAHQQALAYITPTGGGMEYAGATITSLWALGHEFTHSWFARGVMPADGNSGWIDEAIASWRDNSYVRDSDAKPSTKFRLSGFPDFRRHTTMRAYDHGANVISSLDRLFAGPNSAASEQNGMRPVLKKLFGDYHRNTISVGIFQKFLEEQTGINLRTFFQDYVFAPNPLQNDLQDMDETIFQNFANPTQHPRKFSKEELRRFL